MTKLISFIHNLNVRTITAKQSAAIKGGSSFDETEEQGKHKTGG
ncbi:MAG: hypothetical protein AAF990_24365 [Bacteroidota bacterium]